MQHGIDAGAGGAAGLQIGDVKGQHLVVGTDIVQ
ncbi:Uncharacterised protein [Serratia odorifera]|uniref:Uncharacterized protein n=1 Tax=Serratia odorifera TaxID=618 RepID=A0A3S4FLP1_SEROD|nr:Uncharacterised protein [Serratia odorifera]